MVADPEYAPNVGAALVRLFTEGDGVAGVLGSLPAIWQGRSVFPYSTHHFPHIFFTTKIF